MRRRHQKSVVRVKTRNDRESHREPRADVGGGRGQGKRAEPQGLEAGAGRCWLTEMGTMVSSRWGLATDWEGPHGNILEHWEYLYLALGGGCIGIYQHRNPWSHALGISAMYAVSSTYVISQ